jgi:hypothetical protein
MTQVAVPFNILPDVDHHFDVIDFSLKNETTRTLEVVMYGARRLSLRFTQVIAVRHEDECPGYDPLPKDLPKLAGQIWTFPLLTILGSTWKQQWDFQPQQRQHFALISAGDLVQIVASPEVEAKWLPFEAKP